MESRLADDVNTIWAIGRNYSLHAKEMGAETPSAPVVFLKSAATIVEGRSFTLPRWSSDIHHEIELAVRIDDNLRPSHVALAIDLTARDKQAELKEKKLPWALAKSFKESCPLSPFIPYEGDPWFENLSFTFSVNDTIRQAGATKDMVFPLPALIEHLRSVYPLQSGDLILTGTPSGVGELKSGDTLHGEIMGHLQMSWNVN